MKKLIKSLAVLLALVLVLGTVSAAAADAKVTLKQTTKSLFLGKSTGTKLDGTKCATGETKQMKNMLNNFDAETMKLIVSSDDETIVSVNKTTIKGEKIGTTTVNVLVLDKATNDVILNKNVKVTVKKNATAETIKVTGIDAETYSVNDVLNVTMPRSGVYTDTAALKADSDDVVITPGEKSRTWTVSFKKAGNYTITGYTFQSSTYAGETASVEYKIAVLGTQFTGVQQVASESFALQFDGETKDLGVTADKIRIYTKNSKGIAIDNVKTIKEVTPVDNTVVVECYGAFTKDTTYYVEYAGETFYFAGCDTSAAAIAYFDINNLLTVAGEFSSALTVTCYDANGVKLTGVVPAGLTFEKVSGTTGATLATDRIYLATTDDTIVVKAYYKTYDADNNYKEVIHEATSQKSFTGVAASAATGNITPLVGLVSELGAVDKTKTPAVATAVNRIVVGDTLIGIDFFSEVVAANGDKSYKDAADCGYTLYSSDEKIFVMSGKTIIPVKDGTAYVLVKDTNGNVVYSEPVKIDPARKATSFKAEPAKATVNVAAAAADTMGINITVYDQYGDEYTGSAVTFSVNNVAGCDWTVTANNAKGGSVTGHTTLSVVAADGAAESSIAIKTTKNIVLEVKNADLGAKIVSFRAGRYVDKAADSTNGVDVSAYKLEAGKSLVDTTLTLDTTTTDVNNMKFTVSMTAVYGDFKLYDMGAKMPIRTTELQPVDLTVTNASGAVNFTYVVKGPDGSQITDDIANLLDVQNGKIDVTPVYAVASSAIEKLAKGKYTVTMYKLTTNANLTRADIVGVPVTFEITDNQAKVNAVKTAESYSTTISNKADALTQFLAAFDFKLNGKTVADSAIQAFDGSDLTDSTNFKVDAGSKSVVYLKATATVPFAQLGDASTTLDIEVADLPAVVKYVAP